MENLDRYRLSKKDINTGIRDFLTQLLIEAKRQKKGARVLSDLSSENPTISYMVGQPGAGKTSLGRYILIQYNERGESAVEVSSDKIATYHRDYSELLKLLPDECYTISRQFVKPAEPRIMEILIQNKLNILLEKSLSKGERDYENLRYLKSKGYRVEINIMAVDRYESLLSCIERDINLLELGYDPRPIARINHDRMYDSFLYEIMEITRRGLCDTINVFARGEVLTKPKLIYSTGDKTYSSAQEAVIAERAKKRNAIMQEPQIYLQRLMEAEQKIQSLVSDENIRINYLYQLRQLKREFENELIVVERK